MFCKDRTVFVDFWSDSVDITMFRDRGDDELMHTYRISGVSRVFRWNQAMKSVGGEFQPTSSGFFWRSREALRRLGRGV